MSTPNWLVSYRKGWLRPDITAELTAVAVVIPKSVAYASIAGLPVQAGLYTAFLPPIIYALLGTSRVLSVSTTTTIPILTAAELGEVAPNKIPEFAGRGRDVDPIGWPQNPTASSRRAA